MHMKMSYAGLILSKMDKSLEELNTYLCGRRSGRYAFVLCRKGKVDENNYISNSDLNEFSHHDFAFNASRSQISDLSRPLLHQQISNLTVHLMHLILLSRHHRHRPHLGLTLPLQDHRCSPQQYRLLRVQYVAAQAQW